MAKKSTKSAPKAAVARSVAPIAAPAEAVAAAPVVTPVRNTPLPKPVAAIKRAAPSYDSIQLRAYFIWQSTGGNAFDNWVRAERELSTL